MHIYDFLMRPLERSLLADLRKQFIPKAKGDVLELGTGTGANIPYYDKSEVKTLTCLDKKLHKGIVKKARDYQCTFVTGDVENLSFPDNYFDSVVATLLLCSVTDAGKAIGEIKRVLKPHGMYIFIEHIAPKEEKLLRLFNTINKVWPKLANGCNLNRRTDLALQRNGFAVLKMEKNKNGIFCYGIGRK